MNGNKLRQIVVKRLKRKIVYSVLKGSRHFFHLSEKINVCVKMTIFDGEQVISAIARDKEKKLICETLIRPSVFGILPFLKI